MPDGAMQRLRFGRVLVLACATAFLALVSQPSRAQEPECLIEIHKLFGGAVPDTTPPSTLCQVASTTAPKLCTFVLQLCHNEPGCTVGNLKKAVHATGHCNPAKLKVLPSGSACGAFTGIKVRPKGKGRKPGKCVIRVGAHSSDRPGQNDVDRVLLECKPTGMACP